MIDSEFSCWENLYSLGFLSLIVCFQFIRDHDRHNFIYDVNDVLGNSVNQKPFALVSKIDCPVVGWNGGQKIARTGSSSIFESIVLKRDEPH